MTDDTEATTLLEFADGEDDGRTGDPTPEQNAEHIRYLIDCVERLTEKVGDIEQYDTNGVESDPAGCGPAVEDETTERMFQ